MAIDSKLKSALLNCLDSILQDLNKFTDDLDIASTIAHEPDKISEYSKGVWASKQIILKFIHEIDNRL